MHHELMHVRQVHVSAVAVPAPWRPSDACGHHSCARWNRPVVTVNMRHVYRRHGHIYLPVTTSSRRRTDTYFINPNLR